MSGDRPAQGWIAEHRIALLLGLIVLVGTVLRLVQFGQSVSGDELSTLWIVRDRNLGEVIGWVKSDAEITPPLSFILSWLSVQLGSAPELVRLPALVSGIASIPLTFVLGRKLISERAGLVASAVMALGPLMIFFAGNGRAYTLMVLLLIGSTLAMLRADETGKAGWWVAYGALSCLAMYSHYTAAFVLVAQLAWLLVARPPSRLPGVLANVGAAILFLPWISGLRADLDSPTTLVLEALQGNGFSAKVSDVKGWAFGHPFIDPNAVPGEVAMVIITLALAVAAVLTILTLRHPAEAPSTGSAGSPPGVRSAMTLIVLIAIVTPVGELVLGLIGTDLFGTRNMVASWYGLALLAGAILTIPVGIAATACTVVVLGGYAYAAVDLLRPENRIVGFKAPARAIDRQAEPGDVVVDILASLSTPVPLTALDAAMSNDLPLYSPNHPVSEPPFLPNTVIVPPVKRELEKAVEEAAGHRIFMYSQDWVPVKDAAESGRSLRTIRFEDSTVFLPVNARIVGRTSYPGIPKATLYVIEVN